MSEAQLNDFFNFELVSPERKLISEKAWQVTIPGQEGEFGVRANHSSLMSAIRPGVVEIISKQGDNPSKIFIAGGFADVTAENCTILAEEAIFLSDLKQEQIEKEINAFEEKLADAKDTIEINRYTNNINLAKAKLIAVTGA